MFTLDQIITICDDLKLSVDRRIIKKKFHQARDLDEFCNSIVDDILYPDSEKLAVFLLMSRQHSKINVVNDDISNLCNFLAILEKLRDAGVISEKFLEKANSKISAIKTIHHGNDFNYSYLSLIMLMKGYFCKIKDTVLECPQFMFLRTSIQLHDDEKLIKQTYNLLSEGAIIHASPTLFNAGTRNPQLSSCFLICLKDDSISGIYKTLSECADISKHGGGIGISLSNLRSKYSYIESSQNQCKGVKPVLDCLEHCSQYVDQGGRRKGAICVYFEISHPEVPEVLVYKRHTSRENHTYDNKIKDLFLGLWIPDLFMERVKTNERWSFFDRKDQKKLTELYGKEYVEEYLRLENEKAYVRQIDAAELFNEIIKTQVETGGPFICYKDTANYLSNQKNSGVIKSSNLCTEIFEVSSENETAVCNLANLNLEKCINSKNEVDYERIGELTRILTQNLNNSIDNNFYCSEYTRNSNLNLRPLGIGVTGLQGLFFRLKIPFTSNEARKINSNIFEVIYFNALKESNRIAKNKTNRIVKYSLNIPYFRELVKSFSGCYPKFWGSPLSRGETHVDLYEKLSERKINKYISGEAWSSLKNSIKTYGVSNSLLVALMPTVSTSEIVGSTDCFEPITEAIVYKNTQHGNFRRVNKYIRQLLIDKQQWNQENIDSIIKNNGSVQHFLFLTEKEKSIYKTAWEIDPIDYIKLAIDRAPFIDQSQSLSWFIEDPGRDLEKLGKLHFYTWENKLKTGMYYLRQIPVSQTRNFKKKDYDMKKCVACS